MDLSKFVTEEPPPARSSRTVWEQRFEQIIGQGLTGKWINATEAWELAATNGRSAERAAERCGLTIEVRHARKQLFVRVK
jgi:hypothetical protein